MRGEKMIRGANYPVSVKAPEQPVDKQDRLKQQIVEAVTSFQKSQMSVNCESIAVDFHPDTLVVTLCGATCPAERDCARERRSRELLEKFYRELFHVIKPILESKIQEILGRRVRRSRLDIDPESGDGVVLLTLASEAHVPQEEAASQNWHTSRE
jgi:uncharacterized protein YbcI